MSFWENIGLWLVFATIAAVALILVLFPGGPQEPPTEVPLEPVNQPSEPPTEPSNGGSLCPSSAEKIVECEVLFEERMDNVELLFNNRNQSRPFSSPPLSELAPSFFADSARQAFSAFIQSYTSCASDLEIKHAILLEELMSIDEALDFVTWNSIDLANIVCVEVSV